MRPALILVLAGAILAGCRSPKPKPLEVSYWYWHTGFHLEAKTRTSLQSLGIKEIFVRAGTFTTDGANLKMVLPQEWSEKSPFDIHLVFNFDSGAVSHFEEMDLNQMVEDIATRIEARRQEAKAQHVVGIQLDFDCPTRLLPRYAKLVEELRPRLSGHTTLSATALMSWIDSDKVIPLCRALDFLVPQAYEGITGKSIDEMRPVSDPVELKRLLPEMGRLPCPIYIGLPAYGHAFTFGAEGKLEDIFRGRSPAELLQSPGVTVLDAYPADRLGKPAKDEQAWTGEQILKLQMPTRKGPKQIGFTIPTPALLEKTRQIVEASRPANCRGIIVYRIPDEDDSLTIPLESARGEPKLKITAERRQDSFDAIENDLDVVPGEIYLSVKNIGQAPTFVSRDAVVLTLDLSDAEIQDVRLNDAVWAEPGRVESNGFAKTPSRHATAARFGIPYLAPGQAAEIGPIRLFASAPKRAKIRWKVRTVDGFKTLEGQADL